LTVEAGEPLSNPQRFADEIAWLLEAARYFASRSTGGEDRAHWANVYNAENANKAAALIERLSAEREGVVRERVPNCVCTFVGEWDGYSGVVAHHSGPWPVWIDKSCPVHGAAPAQGGGQLSGNTGELAEAVEIVTEWLAMAEAVPTQTHGVLRYPPISQGELDAIAILAKGDSHE
jgi:hypothetical protein